MMMALARVVVEKPDFRRLFLDGGEQGALSFKPSLYKC